jgi:hypothetical protein
MRSDTPRHESSLLSNLTGRDADQPLDGTVLLRRVGRVAAGLAVLIMTLALAGSVYQAIASVVIMVLALADQIYRFIASAGRT